MSKLLPTGLSIRQAVAADAGVIHALLRPYVMQSLLLARTEPEIIELTRHGFVAEVPAQSSQDENLQNQNHQLQIIGFSAVEIYSAKLAELQCLAVQHQYQGTGVGKGLVTACVDRARELGVMEVMAISSSEDFLKTCGFEFSLPDQKKALFCQLKPRPEDM